MNGAVNHPGHYMAHPLGVECLDVTRHMGFNLGNAVKYLWRAGLKGDALEDLEKALFYIRDALAQREGQRRCGRSLATMDVGFLRFHGLVGFHANKVLAEFPPAVAEVMKDCWLADVQRDDVTSLRVAAMTLGSVIEAVRA